MKLYYLKCKQFQLVDSILSGRVREEFFGGCGRGGLGAVEIFVGQRRLTLLEKIGPYATAHPYTALCTTPELEPNPVANGEMNSDIALKLKAYIYAATDRTKLYMYVIIKTSSHQRTMRIDQLSLPSLRGR